MLPFLTFLTFQRWHMTPDRWHMTPIIWLLKFDTWHWTFDTWHMKLDNWHLKWNLIRGRCWLLLLAFLTWDTWHDIWHLTPDMLQLTFDTWQLTLYTWHVKHDTSQEINDTWLGGSRLLCPILRLTCDSKHLTHDSLDEHFQPCAEKNSQKAAKKQPK